VRRRALLASLPWWVGAAAAQPLTQGATVPACFDHQRCYSGSNVPPGASLDLSFMSPGTLDPRITFTRAAGPATYFDASGVLRMAAVNLLLQSGDLSNAAWIKFGNIAAAPTVTGNQVVAPDGTTTAARAVFPAVSAGAGSLLAQAPTVTSAAYTFSVWLRGSVGGERLYLFTTADTSVYYRTAVTLTTAWQRFTLTTATLTAAAWNFEIGTDLRDAGQSATPAQTIFAWGAQLEVGSAASPYIPTASAANGAPRWDYDPVTHLLKGLLIEEARTNLSPTVGSYTISSSLITPNSGTAPDGTNTMCRVTPTSASAAHYILINTFTLVASASYTVSVFAAAQQYRYLQLFMDDGTNGGFATFDLQAGVISGPLAARGAGVLGAASMTPAGNGVYRCSITAAGTGTTGRCGFILSTTANPAFAPVFAGTTANGLLVWGAQFEQGAFATSYIPTTAAAVTRAQDSCTITPANMGWFTPPGGSWMAEFIDFNPPSSTSARVIAYPLAGNITPLCASLTLQCLQYDGANGMNTVNTFSPGAVTKGATTWAVGAARSCLNAGAVASSAALTAGYAALATGGTRLMADETPGDGMSGCLRRLRYWPRVLSNTELQQVTT
jgi:hypothetical protein